VKSISFDFRFYEACGDAPFHAGTDGKDGCWKHSWEREKRREKLAKFLPFFILGYLLFFSGIAPPSYIGIMRSHFLRIPMNQPPV